MSGGLEGLLTGHTLVKRYTIEEVIGRGGFAVVYRATDTRLERPVAVKVITLTATDPAQHEALRQRLHREAQAAASLPHHPNLVTVHDVGTDPELGLDFLVMELLRGENLSQALARDGRPPLPRALRILRDAAEGLAVGHRAGLIHRDVKPGNIFLAEGLDGDGPESFRVCVLDYGIAQAIEDDQTVTRGAGANPLSPAYASPEQIRGERELTAATDVFSLGVAGYQLLTGERPFSAGAGQAPSGWTVRRPLRELNPQVPAAVEQVVTRAMAIEPGDRYPDADAFGQALDAATHRDLQTQVHAALSHIAVPPPDLGEEIDETVLAPAAAAPAAAHQPPGEHIRRAARAMAPAAARPRRRWPVVLVLALLLAGAAAWAAMSGGGGGREADAGLPGDTTQLAVPEEEPASPGEAASVPAFEPGTGEPAAPVPAAGAAVTAPAPGAEPPAGPEPPPAEPAQPQVPQPQPQQPAPAEPQPQQPARPPAQQPPAQRPPAQQPAPPQERPPAQQPPPQEPPQEQPPPAQPREPPRRDPPLLGVPVEPRPAPPRDTIRIGTPPPQVR